MFRIVIGGLLCVAIAVFPALASTQQGNNQRPNIVLIITDDVGYGDFGSYGAPDVKTPSIDSLARDGIRLTDFYANGATCSPTRAGLISGRYQQRFGLERPLGVQGAKDWERGLSPTGRSLPQLLKNSGYATALVGKWHLGWKAEFSPTSHGFDCFFGFKSGFIDYYQHTAGADSPLKADLFENDRPVEVPGYMTASLLNGLFDSSSRTPTGRSLSMSRSTRHTGRTNAPMSRPRHATTADTSDRSTMRRAHGQTTSRRGLRTA